MRCTWPPARTLFLHGPSGGGKSTLLGLLAGVLLPRAGTVSLLGTRLGRAVRRAARCLPRRPRRLHLPAVQPAALPERARQRAAALPLLGPAPAARHGRAPARRRPRPRALLQRVGLSQALWPRRGVAAVGGPAAARGRGARADRPARTGDRRRADLGAGQRAARRLHGAAAAAMPRRRQHAGLRQPRRAAGRAVRRAACRCRRSTAPAQEAAA